VNLRPHWLSWCVAGLLFAAVLARFAGGLWLGGVLRELDVQLCVLGLLLGAVAVFQRAWPALVACSALVLTLGAPPVLLARSTRPTPSTGPTLRVLGAHLGTSIPSAAELLTELVSGKTDLAVITSDSSDPLGPLAKGDTLRNYRTLHGAPQAPWVLLIRKELLLTPKGRATRPGGARIQVGACDLGVHPLAVPSLFVHGQRDVRGKRLLALRTLGREKRSLWLGQLGSSPGASDTRSLLDAQELRDGRLGYGRMPSWPSALGHLGVPLEHLLVHGWLRVSAFTMDSPLAAGAQRTLRATLELTEPACRGTP
jgi:hypothetical protein